VALKVVVVLEQQAEPKLGTPVNVASDSDLLLMHTEFSSASRDKIQPKLVKIKKLKRKVEI
jgi:hypothetical protein